MPTSHSTDRGPRRRTALTAGLLSALLLTGACGDATDDTGAEGATSAADHSQAAHPAADATATPARGAARAPADGPQPSLTAMLARLDELSGEVEDARDVKCWTSFKKFETFVAGCQLEHETTHVKTEVVIGWLDQLWRAAADASDGTVVRAEALAAAADAHVPATALPLMRTRVAFGEAGVELPDKDISNYKATVEPVRVLQTLAQRVAATDPGRPGLDEPALEAAHHLAALLSAALLKEGSTEARRNQHLVMDEHDVLAADARLAPQAGLQPYDPARWPELTEAAGAAEAESSPADALARMLAVVDQKLASLDHFNTTYVRDRLSGSFDADLSAHDAEWAGRPVDADVGEHVRTVLVPRMARELHRRAAEARPDLDPLTGPAVLDAIVRRYPFVTSYDGYVNLFPLSGSATNVWVEEFQADAFRDAGWHWWALGEALREPAVDGLPALDLYAMEELTEFLSVYGVGLLMIAGNWAADAPSVTRAHLDLALTSVAQDADAYEARGADAHAEDDLESTRVEGGERLALAALDAAYIDTPFSDVSADSGLDFVHEISPLVHDFRFDVSGDSAVPYLTERREQSQANDGPAIPHLEIGIGGGGVTVGDVDGDGRLDAYLVSGGRDRLYRNLGALRFEDATEGAGLVDDGEGRGAYFVDHDGDGDQDLFVTQVYAPSRLFANRGDGTFEDVTGAAGLSLADDRLSHSATWFDHDNDGALDLYVGNHGDWLAGVLPLMMADSRNAQPNVLYRGDGAGGYADVTAATGAGDVGWCHAVSHYDANADGWQDLFIANDFGEDVLLGNVDGERFVNGTPRALDQAFRHGMSVGFSDVDRDGIDDVYVSNIAMFTFDSKYIMPQGDTRLVFTERTTLSTRMAENNVLLVSNGGQYEEAVQKWFDRSLEGCGWAWDADFLDFDNDGEEDLYVANGREPNLTYDAERNVLFKQQGGHFYDVSAASGADFAANSRGVVHADLDGDGDLDLLVNNYLGPPTLLRNELQRNHWFQLRLQAAGSNREAYGARVGLRTGERVQFRTVRGGSGFLSKEPATLHFGLGGAEHIDQLEVVWPGGQRQQLSDLPVNGEFLLVQGESKLTRLR